MIAAVSGAPCALQRRTESGLQARPLFFNSLQAVFGKLCHNCDMGFRFVFALFVGRFARFERPPNPLEILSLLEVRGGGVRSTLPLAAFSLFSVRYEIL
jgi:hypothetical protein